MMLPVRAGSLCRETLNAIKLRNSVFNLIALLLVAPH